MRRGRKIVFGMQSVPHKVFTSFSDKQRQLLCWWCKGSPFEEKSGVICDGAVRSGKTVCMALSYIFWCFNAFEEERFGLCGKTLGGLRRNVVTPLVGILEDLGFVCKDAGSKNYLDISMAGQSNRFYLFSGKDEASAARVQGVTLAGVLFDEVALMPRSFVEQAVARCSVEGSRLWFNCNPENPRHWFYLQWIAQAEKKNLLYLHFTMEDNPSLSTQMLARYRSLYSGAFFERFVLGRWVAIQGAVYPMFCVQRHVVDEIPACERFAVSCDYGTVNPTSMGLWGEWEGGWVRIAEYYHDARLCGEQKTDEEYYEALIALTQGYAIDCVIVDPSAASFIACIRRRGSFRVLAARNEVLEGIRTVGGMLREGRLLFHSSCVDTLREFELYRWDEHVGKDLPMKENDHAMDDMRYLVMTLAADMGEGFCALSSAR